MQNIKLLEDSIGENLGVFRFSSDFFIHNIKGTTHQKLIKWT